MNSNAQHTNAGTAQAAAHPVVGRFAPSPSGRMHLGNVYSALVAWLSVRSQNGRMVLRIEDLDERCRRGKFDEQLIADLRWLGLDWDEGPYYQSDRLDLYRDAVRALASQDLVYPCFCTRAELHAASAPHASDGTPLYPGTCRNLDAGEVARRRALKAPALRLKVPDEADPAGIITFNDRTYGTVSECLAADCGDFLIQRSDGVFAYQLVVTVDDEHMGVTEVVRGRDLLGRPRARYTFRTFWATTIPAMRTFPCSQLPMAAVSPNVIETAIWENLWRASVRPRSSLATCPISPASRPIPRPDPSTSLSIYSAGAPSASIAPTLLLANSPVGGPYKQCDPHSAATMPQHLFQC